MQGAQVQILVRQLRSHMLHSADKNNNNNNKCYHFLTTTNIPGKKDLVILRASLNLGWLIMGLEIWKGP